MLSPVVVEAATRSGPSQDNKLPPLTDGVFSNFSVVVSESPCPKKASAMDVEEKMGGRKPQSSSPTSSATSSSRFGWLGGGKKAAKLASADELGTVQRSLMAHIAQSETDMAARLTRVSENLRQDLNEQLRTMRVERMEAIKTAGDEIQQSMIMSLEGLQGNIDGVEKQLGRRLQEFSLRLDGLDGAIAEVSRVAALNLRSYDDSIVELRKNFDTDMGIRFSKLLALLQQQQRDHDSALACLSETMEEYQHSNKNALADTQAGSQTLHEQALEEFRKLRKELESLVDARMQPLEKVVDVFSSKEGQGVPSRAEMDQKLFLVEQNSESKLACLDAQTRSLRVAVAEVENIPTRRVEWHLTQASEVLEAAAEMTEDLSFFSPEFEAGGAHGLQLELRLLAKSANDSAVQSKGDCELLLWGAECSLTLVFRLYIGTAHVNLHHKFDGLQPCSTGSLCSIKDHINWDDDSLHLGIEILEAIREVTLPSRLAAFSDIDKDSCDELASFPWRESAGALVSHRHLIHRTLDLVQDQVDLMKSRMVHRVEWRVERASELRRCFPAGECLCSSSFDAGGIEGLQLVFFPSGQSDAREGHCSLYVYCPPGSFLHCWLMLGRQRWEASKAFETSNGYYGKTSFCRFDACVDEKDNTILVAMELQEARQDFALPPHSHTPLQRPAGGATAIDSVVTLRRAPPQNTLADVKVLPSIWTSKPNGVVRVDQGVGLEDFRTFDEILVPKKPMPPAPRRIASGGRCRPSTANGRALEGSPRLSPVSDVASERYQMYAAC